MTPPTSCTAVMQLHVRQAIESSCVVELFLLYDLPNVHKADPRFTKSRRIAFASRAVEQCILWLPSPKKQVLKVQPRTHFTKVGETSTHDCTYSGVDVRSFDQLPKMTVEDKSGIIGKELKLSFCVVRAMMVSQFHTAQCRFSDVLVYTELARRHSVSTCKRLI